MPQHLCNFTEIYNAAEPHGFVPLTVPINKPSCNKSSDYSDPTFVFLQPGYLTALMYSEYHKPYYYTLDYYSQTAVEPPDNNIPSQVYPALILYCERHCYELYHLPHQYEFIPTKRMSP